MEIWIFLIRNQDDGVDLYDIIHLDNNETLSSIWPWQWPYYVLICFRDIIGEENYQRITTKKVKESFNSPELSDILIRSIATRLYFLHGGRLGNRETKQRKHSPLARCQGEHCRKDSALDLSWEKINFWIGLSRIPTRSIGGGCDTQIDWCQVKTALLKIWFAIRMMSNCKS